MATKMILTTTPELERSALREFQGIAPDVKKIRSFVPGLSLITTKQPLQLFIQAIIQCDPIFAKHIMPVQTKVSILGKRTIDLPAILDGVHSVNLIGSGDLFSVQCRRKSTRSDYNAKDVEVFIGSNLEYAGGKPVFSDIKVAGHPDHKVVSVYLFNDRGYIGCSSVKENLNEHADEYRVFSRQGRVINRAELKLLEALRKFELDVGSGRALDLGAAPGGWTRVLANRGMKVMAVDPALLDERVQQLPNVTHLKGRAEEYADLGMFDLLVNDMNIDPERSAGIMLQMAPYLRPEAAAIMTAKLTTRQPETILGKVRLKLGRDYKIVRMRSLFHNRREVTILLRKIK